MTAFEMYFIVTGESEDQYRFQDPSRRAGWEMLARRVEEEKQAALHPPTRKKADGEWITVMKGPFLKGRLRVEVVAFVKKHLELARTDPEAVALIMRDTGKLYSPRTYLGDIAGAVRRIVAYLDSRE